ncbi:hypothetical protein [Luteimonas saliphila]|uniref:hypothetical protein n=1 Tax=Luteimonas saliphila TaxID=2804919 RepID=UPI00192D63DC|nr:hypothetical protein [Luteimonas saliphila]
MAESSAASARVEDGTARLDATFSPLSADTLRVRYRMLNGGDAPLAVFDRGNRHAVLSKRQTSGAVGAPTFEEVGGGDVVLRHVALPAAQGHPTGPTVPLTPLALKLDPGATLEGEFSFAIPTATPPRRVRWCLGVATFDPGHFFSPEQVDAGETWQAGEAAVQAQRTLCTPWFDIATGTFAAG